MENLLTLKQLLAPYAQNAERWLEQYLIEPGTPNELVEAMIYCTAGGKRLRPALVQMAAKACEKENSDQNLMSRAAIAIECVHVYSLVHDDLPAMDDDDLRRGRPTAHIKFGEPMAILIGDALQTRAFSMLTENNSARSGQVVCALAQAAGPAGMVAGQVADMQLCQIPSGFEGMEYIHLRKTAAMLVGAVKMGAIAAGATEDELSAVAEYAEKIGLAFQLQDDLLDVTATAEELGKTPGKDAATGKTTVVSELGQSAARELVESLTEQAITALTPLGQNASDLISLAKLLINRTY